MNSTETDSKQYFLSQDNLRLRYKYSGPNPNADLVVLVHGHGEHIGRYEKFFLFLNSHGYSVAAFDARGYGLSAGKQAHIQSFESFIRDLSDFISFIRQKYNPGRKVILFGHSLGGLVAFHWALKNEGGIDGVILSSPCLGLRLGKPLVLLIKCLSRIFPGAYFQKPVYPPHLSHNQKELDLYEKDTLIRRKISVRLLEQMITYGQKVNTSGNFSLTFPFFMILAGLEKIVDLPKSLAVYDRIQAPLKGARVFEGFYHEVFNELEQAQAFQVLLSNLKAISEFK